MPGDLILSLIAAVLVFVAGWWVGCREHKRVWWEGWEQGQAWGLAGRYRPGDKRAER
jgi:hypothetical protein